MRDKLLKPDSTKNNFIFQILYQAIILVIPLIVSPYLTRTMGSTSLGIYTYTYSIAYYFVIVAMLGINRHGQRIIAQRSAELLSLRKTFWSLYAVHFIASILVLIAYLVYVLTVCNSDMEIALIQAIYVFSAAIDITWLFYGLEKFRTVAIRNAFVKILESFCIFTFVKSPSDIGTYTLIMAVSVCAGRIIMMPQVVLAIPPIRFNKTDMREHIRPLFTLFAATLAVTLYTVFDKTLLGVLATKDDVAFYEYSDKVVGIPRTFISIIGTVLFPRACRYAADRDMKRLEQNFNICLIVNCFIGFASCFGLAAIADQFAIIYYGEAFAVCGSVIKCMCPIVLIIGFGETIRQSYIYPLKMDTAMVRILSINAVMNLVLSAILIPVIGIYGAVIGTISAEMVGLVAELWICRKYLPFKNLFAYIIPFAGMGAIMYAVIKFVEWVVNGNIVGLLVQIAVGAVVYGGLSMVYCYYFNSMTKGYMKGVIQMLQEKIRRKIPWGGVIQSRTNILLLISSTYSKCCEMHYHYHSKVCHGVYATI